MADKCDVCGHETSVLDHGTGEYAEKMVCGLCEDRNFREQLLRVEVGELRGKLEGFTKAKISIGKRDEVIEAAKKRLANQLTWNEITDFVDELLELAGIEVEEPPEPPVMPEGLSAGTWKPERHHHGGSSFKITAGGNGLAYHLSEEDAKFMAGAKTLAKVTIMYLEGFKGMWKTPGGVAFIKALEDMDCNVSKFRGC